MTNIDDNAEEMVNDVIRNPNRTNNVTAPEPYVPEYIRLGRYPVIQGVDYIDGQPIDLEVETANNHIIDNNDYVSYDFGMEHESIKKEKEKENTGTPEVGEFILMVDGKIICCGDNSFVINETKKILYGEHKQFTTPVNQNNIVLLKRMGIKIGVFLDE